MLKELLRVTNLKEALDNQINIAEPKRGLYIFLEDKAYESDELTDEFLAKQTSFISKNSVSNPLLEEKIKMLGIYGYAINPNKQILSVQGLNTVYSKMYTIANIQKFLSSNQEVGKVTHFFNTGFGRSYTEDRFNKMLSITGEKSDKKNMKEKKDDMIANIMDQYQDTLVDISDRAMNTLRVIQSNRTFINQIIDYYSELYPSDIKTMRLNIIVSDDLKLDFLEEESFLYFYPNLLANKGIYQDGQAYFYSSISANYNEKKAMMYLNRSDAPNIGNELLLESELDKHVLVYLFIRALAQTTKGAVKTFYIRDNKIVSSPDVGDLRYKVLDDKGNYYILEYSPLSEWSRDATRPFLLDFKVTDFNKIKSVLITNYEQLANIIFFGSKEKQIRNQLYVDKSAADNAVIKNKYFEGNKLSPESKSIYQLIIDVGNFDDSVNKLTPIFKTIRKDLLLNSRYETISLYQSIENYKNMVSFWDNLTGTSYKKYDDTIYLNKIQNDEDFLRALIRVHIMLFEKINRFSNKKETRYVFDSTAINKMLKTTRYSQLLNNLIQYKKQYQYIFNELNKEYILEKEKEAELEWLESETATANKYQKRRYKHISRSELIEDIDFISICIKLLKGYQPSRQVINHTEDSIYALIDETIIIKINEN